MEILPAGPAIAIAVLCAAVMGYAIQRGATCTVAAVDEVVKRGSARRLAALVEASVWVAGGLLLAQALQALPAMPAGYPVSRWTLAGGVLLGLGAFVNRACVFGAIARLGSGEWAYLATPLGFYLGCLSVPPLFMPSGPQPLEQVSPVLQASGLGAVLFLAFAGWRVATTLQRRFGRAARATRGQRPDPGPAATGWSPHAATTVIGVTFVVMLLLVGAWAYTDLLADLARGMPRSLAARGLLLLALLLGAIWGGWRAGKLRSTPATPARVLRCLAGGALMGWGTLLIPGSNDGLILVGMPLLWPYAWVAFVTMCVSIAGVQVLINRRRGPLTSAAAQ